MNLWRSASLVLVAASLVASLTIQQRRRVARKLAATFLLGLSPALCSAGFTMTYVVDELEQLTESQQSVLIDAMDVVVTLWEGVIVGHQSQPTLDFQLRVFLNTSGLASAGPQEIVKAGGYTYPTSGNIWLNKNQILPATEGLGIAPGVDVLDELLAHEAAHALGFGTLWRQNGIYATGSGKYLGAAGLAAYRQEFDATASWIPVELAGANSSANSHWDQLLRSASGEGNPDDPLSLSPLIGVADELGRDIALELMTAAIDPDYGEPFLSHTTIQSLRDLGFQVVPEPVQPAFWLALLVRLPRKKRSSQQRQAEAP